jgi:hypothetical protein
MYFFGLLFIWGAGFVLAIIGCENMKWNSEQNFNPLIGGIKNNWTFVKFSQHRWEQNSKYWIEAFTVKSDHFIYVTNHFCKTH